MPDFHPDMWPEVVGGLVIEWGRIESTITSTVAITLDTGDKPDIRFENRMKQWKNAVAPLGADAPHDTTRLYGRLFELRITRESIVHGMYAGFTENKARYLVQSPNKGLRQRLEQRAIRQLPPIAQREVRKLGRDVAKNFIEKVPIHEITFDPETILDMVSADLPECGRQLQMTMFALTKWHVQSLIPKK